MKMTETFELLSPSELIPSPTNARVHSERQLRYLRGSLREFGFVSPVVVDAKNNIIAGHAMVEVAIAENFELVPCVRVEHLTDTQRRAYMIADNRLAEMASWDTELLQVNLQDLFENGFDLSITGFGEYKLADALAKESVPVTETAAKQPERVQAGELWQLGNHRLLCGDATRGADMARLMCGERVHLLLTDPPYNVDYEGSTEDKLTILNDNMPEGQFQAFLTDAFVHAKHMMREGAAFYIWHASSHAESFHAACRSAGLSVRQTLVWVKNHFVMGRQDYHWQHEPCLYGWAEGGAHHWYGGDSQSTVLQFDKPLANREHPTMKPPELFARLIRSSTKKGDTVLDPFCGSGTSILAAESYGRKCRAMELSARHCDVILARWEAQTGQTATKLRGGESDGRCTTTA